MGQEHKTKGPPMGPTVVVYTYNMELFFINEL